MPEKSSRSIPSKILGVAWLMAFAMWVPMYCIPPMEHILKQELALTHAQIGLLFTAPLIMIVALSIPAGFVADRIGVKKAAGIGAIILAIGAVLRGAATDTSELLIFTLIYGVGLAWIFPNLPKLVSDLAPREKAGIVTGIYATGILTAPALGLGITMLVIFPITGTFQGVFLIWSIPAIIAAILWWRLIKEPPHEPAPKIAKSECTSLLRRVLGNRTIWLIAILFLLHDFFFHTWMAWAPTLMRQKGATPDLAGLMTSLVLWVGIAAVFFIPRLAYRLGLRKPFLWIPGIALALVAWAATRADLTASWPIMALVGFALETRFVTIMALPVELMPRESVGTASGLILSVGLAGGIIGSFVGGRVLDLTGNLDLVLIALIALSVAASILAFRIPETGPKGRANY